uniref:Olfactory receptor n=1 Tax=Pseudonaja textilis TaxID=8673 RepID=A0A670ZBU9_PSETE
MGAENYTISREFILLGLTSHPKTRLLLFVTVLLIYLLTIFGNTLIIILVWVDSQLHTPLYFFLSHLAGMEIGYVTSTLPQMLSHLLNGNGVISLVRCILQGYMTLAMGSTECLLLGAMAYDRYLAICHPLVYALAMDRLRQLLLATFCWTVGFVFSAIYVLCTFCHPFCAVVINHFICEPPVVLKLACGDTRITKIIGFGLSTYIVLVPLFVILTSYGYILNSVLHMRSTGWHKAFSTCGSHLYITVTLLYGTIISMYIVPQSDSTPDRDKKIAVFYLIIIPLLNPIIYTLRNKDIHLAAFKMLKRL